MILAQLTKRQMNDPPQRPPSSFRQRFAELSLEKKLSIFFVPVFAAVVGTLVPRFLGGESAPPPPPSPVTEQREDAPSENLEILDLDVLNSRDEALSGGAGAELRINVRNAGNLVSVIHAAEFDVRDFEEVELCLPPQGELSVSGTYDLTLPSVDGAGQSFEVDVQQQIPAGEPDSFSFRATLDDEYVPTNGDSRLFVLDAFLRHDVEEERVDAGSALLALPFPDVSQFVYPSSGSSGGLYFDPECPARNVARLQRLVDGDAEHSQELERFAADPEADLQSDVEPLPDPTQEDVAAAVGVGEAFVETLAVDGPQAACGLMNISGVARIEAYADVSCTDYVQPLAGLVSRGVLIEVAEAHPGWVKLLGSARGGRPARAPGAGHVGVREETVRLGDHEPLRRLRRAARRERAGPATTEAGRRTWSSPRKGTEACSCGRSP